MAEEHNEKESHDVKKRKENQKSARPRGGARLSFQVMSEFFGGMAEASAEAFRGFQEKIEKKDRKEKPSTLFSDVFEGLAEGNARFLEGLARASRKAYQNLAEEEASRAEPIDYERLARHVVEEMKKTDEGK